MTVIKRDGNEEPIMFDKIFDHLQHLNYNLSITNAELRSVTKTVIAGTYENIQITQLMTLLSETCASLTTHHPDYSKLAARVCINDLHKRTSNSFSDAIGQMYNYRKPRTNTKFPLVSKETYDIVKKYSDLLDAALIYERDYDYSYFGFKTLERSYLIKIDGEPAERPQQLLMRVSVGIHRNDIKNVLHTYDLMSRRYFTHASPTLFSAGTPKPQMSSCFLVAMSDDSIEGIYDTLKTCALISKSSGGVGLHVHNIRASGSSIAGTHGTSNGLVPMLRVFNNTARYVDQGGNKRPGAFCIYVEPWHSDIFEVLDLRKNHGKEEMRARDLFYGLWIPDLFMKRVENNEDWSLFSPNEAPGLSDVYGEEFEILFTRYESEGRAQSKIKAQKLWYAIVEAQTETGGPFMLYKDACNKKSNQSNLGTIKSSNLCTEIVQYSSPNEVGVCNLASLALPMYIVEDDSRIWFDFDKLHEVTKAVVRNLNKIIDLNYYPVKEAERSNLRHRPVAVGVQGLADTFMALHLSFESKQAQTLNIQIFETIYHAAVEASIELAEAVGSYETYVGSPASKGKLQFDLWNYKPSELWNWTGLKKRMEKNGLRNSLLVAPMPTASTSQILGFNESIEPYTSNIFSRRVLAGEFQITNTWLVKDLSKLGLWSDAMRNRIISEGGSIQNIDGIPDDIKAIYKTVWEISQKSVINMAADRAPFIDQSQSLNIHLREPTIGKLTSMHFYGWRKGLKTGMYYLRTKAASSPIQFTVDTESLKHPLVPSSTNILKRKIYSEFSSSHSIENEKSTFLISPPNNDFLKGRFAQVASDFDIRQPFKHQKTDMFNISRYRQHDDDSDYGKESTNSSFNQDTYDIGTSLFNGVADPNEIVKSNDTSGIHLYGSSSEEKDIPHLSGMEDLSQRSSTEPYTSSESGVLDEKGNSPRNNGTSLKRMAEDYDINSSNPVLCEIVDSSACEMCSS